MKNLIIFKILKKKFPNSILLISFNFFDALINQKILEISTPYKKEFVIIFLRKKNYRKILLKLLKFFLLRPYKIITNGHIICDSLKTKKMNNFFKNSKTVCLQFLVIKSKLSKKIKYQIFNNEIKKFLKAYKAKTLFGLVNKNNKIAVKFYLNNKFIIKNNGEIFSFHKKYF